MEYEYHHMGIPTTESREGEKYIPKWKMWVSGYENSEFKVQWHRYEPGSCIHPLVQKVPHVAFKVKDVNNSFLKEEALWSTNGCHLRAVYSARCPADRLSKLTETSTCIQVAVLLVSTGALK